jgi:hypothetical protein
VNIPPPASNIRQLEQMGMPYDNGYLNDPSKATKYGSEFEKAVNLGIYNIDMAYAMLNENSQDVMKYMKTVMVVSEGLGLKNTIASAVGRRAETNTGNKDSLIRIFDDLFDKSDAYLRTNERLYTASLIFAGSWIESLYLNCKISEKAEKGVAKETARRILWEQRFHLKNLIGVLQDYRNKEESKKLTTELTSILDQIMVIKKPEDVDDARFGAISGKIYALRNDMTK